MKFLGIPKETDIEDGNLRDVFKNIRRILTFPYDGFEEEIMELLRIAQEYVEAMHGDNSPKGYGTTPQAQRLLTAVQAVETTATAKISKYIDNTGVSNDLSTIQGCISALGITTEKKEETPDGGIEEAGTPLRMQF